MYKEYIIDDIFGVTQLISEQQYREDLNRHRTNHIYRGMSNTDFKIKTSLQRICKQRSRELEPIILANFTKYVVLENPSIEGNIWQQMILGQHHGLPTRLLDWSFSPLIALHFAMSESSWDDLDKHDCVVWRTDINDLHSKLPEKYQKTMEKAGTTAFSLSMLEETCSGPEEYDRDMEDRRMLILEPPSIEPRIVSQFSFFSVVPTDMTDVEGFLKIHTDNTVKFVIKKELRWQVRDLLDQLNISERIVYPGKDGLSRWLQRHYFVRG